MTSPKITAGLSVAFQTEVLDGGIVTSCKRSRNLVLDVGLDLFADNNSDALLKYVALGTGTRPTRRDSGIITASQAGNTVTASGSIFEAADVGRLLKFDSGAEVYIAAFSSATEVSVSDSETREASAFTVWYVNATGHESEHSRLGSYVSSPSTFTNGVHTITRTFTSGQFAAGVMLREIGWAPGPTGPLFGRALIPGGGDFVGAGKQYRVTVSCSVRYGPDTVKPQIDCGNNGFSTAGAYALEYATVSFSGIGTCIELSSSAAPLTPLVGNTMEIMPALVGSKPANTAPYVAGSFRRSFSATFGVSEGNSSNIRSVCLGSYHTSGWNRRCLRVLLDAPQTKDSMHKLSFSFEMSWGRILIN